MRELTVEEAERQIEITFANAPLGLLTALLGGVRCGMYRIVIDDEGRPHIIDDEGRPHIAEVINILLQEPTGDN